ncbi:NAD(P)/FAD-dependent oxidoreductase [Actinomadura sp. WMMB 499]|uniref:NAD(P)/FAD-dependent oxidoreductase n=1 Tax=Actinomadura sp. WMMB 499 TaxID=1219491 RepID=UPI001246B121|nr:FAD-dependent oxidoreductase [Actinomadura sp. WMMB 499]QFG23328.1 FAD-dependent oxidoreductase [Actinomadura sp. WMMB 499]
MERTVAVVGGGYGGAAAAKALDADADVVLIEPRDAFVQAAGALRALVQPDWAENIFFPYDRLLRRGRVVRDRAASVDPRGVTLASGGRVDADYIVLASGSGYPYPAKIESDDAAEALERLRATHKELAGAGRVLIAGAGPVGLELAGEIKAVWPEKAVTIVDPAAELLPGFLPEVRAELHRQLAELGVDLRLETSLAAPPPVGPAVAGTFTVRAGDTEITADIWFRAHGVSPNGDRLGAGLGDVRTGDGRLRVTERLNVHGHDHVYALGDITDVPEAKMAAHAMRHADVIAANIGAQVRGEPPAAVYEPSPVRFILLPLGPEGGVGQAPGDDGAPFLMPAAQVSEYKGRALLTERFAELFGTG